MPDASAVARTFSELVDEGSLDLPLPGAGGTGKRFAALVELGRRSPVLARLAEGHADALAILAELGADVPVGGRWGVWAAVPKSVTARIGPAGWRLDGERPWCSGAGVVTRALVTAEAQDGPRLFAVEVVAPAVIALDGTWPAVGMAASDSRSVRFADTPAVAVGGPLDYVNRPGFWHGAIGVAACWLGGAIGVAETLLRASRDRQLDPHALAHLGAVDAAITGATAILRQAAEEIDAHPSDQNPLLARRVRAVVEACAVEVLDRCGRALGAGPLCRDGDHAAAVADLTVYLRQSHAERDLADLGGLVAAGLEQPW